MNTVEIVYMTRLIKTNPKEEGMKDQQNPCKRQVKQWQLQ